MSEHPESTAVRGGLTAAPGVPRLLGASIVARLPLAMFSIALLVHARHLTGSFAVAGAVTGAYAAAGGWGGRVLGRVAGRRGQPLALVASGGLAAVVLLALAALPQAVPPAVVVA